MEKMVNDFGGKAHELGDLFRDIFGGKYWDLELPNKFNFWVCVPPPSDFHEM